MCSGLLILWGPRISRSLPECAGAACRGFVACGYEGRCVQKDDVGMIRQKLLASDMVVFATPLYYCGMSAQLKLVVGRFAPITAA
ncbi:flavodoxin family protein [Pseudoscardovia suis]|uniref:flavodoxin family protein n=1 Tax=Pseudoscardovia suis TaxID=987063 RepID=UPI003F9625B7